GGNVRLIAYADSSAGTSGGKVLLSSGSSILTGGKGSGSDGNVTIIAGCRIPSLGPSLTTVSTGLIDTTGGTCGCGGINLSTVHPAFTSGSSMTFGTHGNISSGNDFQATTPAASDFSTVLVNNNLVSGDSVNITSSLRIVENPFRAGLLPYDPPAGQN